MAQQIESGGLGGDLQTAISPATQGLALISPKLVQKILSGDFIDMCELLPETWRVEEPKMGCCRSTRPKRGLVTDIALWTECFASLVAVLTTKHPEKAPQFMGYLWNIVRVSRNFEGSAWASYDAAYRRQSANRRSLEWAVIDPTIYNEKKLHGEGKTATTLPVLLGRDAHGSRLRLHTHRGTTSSKAAPDRSVGCGS